MLEQGSDNLVMMPTVAVGYRCGLSHSEHSHLQVRKGDACLWSWAAVGDIILPL